jgi:hypothetical protein
LFYPFAEDYCETKSYVCTDDLLATLGGKYNWLDDKGAILPGSKVKTGKTILDKITMVPRAAIELARWAWSPRLRHNFVGHDIQLDFVDRVTVCRPQVPSAMDRQLRERSGLYNVTPPDHKACRSFKDKADILYRKWLADEPCRHAEVAVILHSLAWPIPGTKMCNYIGVNKLACVCCQKLLDAINDTFSTNWATGGTHGKFYPWGVLRAHGHDGGSDDENGDPGGIDVAASDSSRYVPSGGELSLLLDVEQRVLTAEILKKTADSVAKEFASCCEKRYRKRKSSTADSDSGTEQLDAGSVHDLDQDEFMAYVATHAPGG